MSAAKPNAQRSMTMQQLHAAMPAPKTKPKAGAHPHKNLGKYLHKKKSR